MDQSPSQESNSHLVDQEIPWLLWNLKFHSLTMFTRAHHWYLS